MTSALLFIESEKLASDDFPKGLKVCAEAWGKYATILKPNETAKKQNQT